MKKAITEIRGEDTAELKAKLNDLRKEQFNLRFRGVADGSTKNTRPREVRRTIARIMMVLGERARTGETKGAPAAPAAAESATAKPAKSTAKAAKPKKAAASKKAKQ
jgi:large subunit ribosomal protein L29